MVLVEYVKVNFLVFVSGGYIFVDDFSYCSFILFIVFVEICTVKDLDVLSRGFWGGVHIPLVDCNPHPFLDFSVGVTVVDEGLGCMFEFLVSEGPCGAVGEGSTDISVHYRRLISFRTFTASI